MFSSRGTVRYEERGQGYRDVEKVGKHCSMLIFCAKNVCPFDVKRYSVLYIYIYICVLHIYMHNMCVCVCVRACVH